MNKTRTVAIGAVRLADPVTGWCDACNLPAIVTMPVAVTLDGRPWCVMTFWHCTTGCGENTDAG